jgi:hypothetical protein
MHLWPNPSILKIITPRLGQVKSNRPKGLKDEEWNAIVADERLNRQIILNTVPKPSKADRNAKKVERR